MNRRKVMVKVLGLQEYQGEEISRIEVEVQGTYSFRDDAHFLHYEEYPGDFAQAVVTLVKYRGGVMEVIRSGEIRSRMVFEKGRRFAAPYVTAAGSMQMEISTEETWMKCTVDGFTAGARYTLAADGEEITRNEIRITAAFTDERS